MNEKELRETKEMRDSFQKVVDVLNNVIDMAERENNGEEIDSKELATAIGEMTMAILNLNKLDI
jgi:hypothetical protein